ncbi:hypothetical protein BCA37_15475 [Mycobacterium sp. djl-10]|nr:hypothetical protein BCA37_15475 [Mycobacterium sp. djl-10]
MRTSDISSPTQFILSRQTLFGPQSGEQRARQADPEPHYHFSDHLRRFITLRDQRCTFPGCTRTADTLDIDHTIAHADHGHTHPSNGKLLCREHHLAKTFPTTAGTWTDEQLPNGDIYWTAPTGHSYLTEPRSRTLACPLFSGLRTK